jgi:hypothetical protein
MGYKLERRENSITIVDGFTPKRILPTLVAVALPAMLSTFLFGTHNYLPVQATYLVVYVVLLLRKKVTTLTVKELGWVDVTHREMPFSAKEFRDAQLRLQPRGSDRATLYFVSGHLAQSAFIRWTPGVIGSIDELRAVLSQAQVNAPEPSAHELSMFVKARKKRLSDYQMVWKPELHHLSVSNRYERNTKMP